MGSCGLIPLGTLRSHVEHMSEWPHQRWGGWSIHPPTTSLLGWGSALGLPSSSFLAAYTLAEQASVALAKAPPRQGSKWPWATQGAAVVWMGTSAPASGLWCGSGAMEQDNNSFWSQTALTDSVLPHWSTCSYLAHLQCNQAHAQDSATWLGTP